MLRMTRSFIWKKKFNDPLNFSKKIPDIRLTVQVSIHFEPSL